MTYWIEFVLVMIPGLFFTLISMLPLGIGTLTAIRHLRKGVRTAYLQNLSGSITAGIITILMLFGSLFSDDLSSSSTAALIFIFVPIYAIVGFAIGYGVSVLVISKSKVSIPISTFSRLLLLVPITILLVLLVGLLKNSIQGNDRAMAYDASNSEVLEQLYNKSLHGEVDPFSIPLGLTQNPNTPPEILIQLSKHEHRAIRTHVAQHKSTPINVVRSLQNDSSLCVREAVGRRLKVRDSNKPVKPVKKPFIMDL